MTLPDDDLRRLASRLRRLLTTPDSGKLIVLLGAGMTVPAVAGVARLTRLARDFSDQAGRPHPRADLNEPVPVSPSVQQLRIAQYVEALQFIREVRGRDGLRAFLQQATLHAHDEPTSAPPNQPIPDSTFIELESSTEGWRVPEGLSLLADVLRTHGERIKRLLLTTNFDHLLEIALRRAGLTVGASYGLGESSVDMAGLSREPTDWTVIHLHGDCHEGTLHYPATLMQPRDEVEDWLAEQLRGSQLLVLGYSGWDGLIQRTLQRHFGRDTEAKHEDGLEVMWAVYESPADHPHVDPELADFFDRYRVRGVTAYYGIDRDRVLRTLTEELDGRTVGVGESRKQSGSAFYRTAKLLNSEYQFGVSRVRPDSSPAFVFWPHRLRAPHLIHGVHALTAALLGKLGIPVELHLDDTDMGRHYADRTAADFTEAVNGWFEVCATPRLPKVFRISHLLQSEPGPEQAIQLWQIAREWYASTNSVFDALVAAKAIAVEAESVAIVPTQAHRLLRPVYTWLALDDALNRHGQHQGRPATAVTLGGIDEQKMWDLWQARPNARTVASIFVPRLESPTEGANLWQYTELRRDTPYGVRDLERFLLRSAGSWPAGAPLLHWVFTAANRLAVLASDSALPGVDGQGGTAASWREAYEQLNHSPAETCTLLAEIVAAWFYHDGSRSW